MSAVEAMETTIYLPTAHGLNITKDSNRRWRGTMQLKGKHVQCVAADSTRPEVVYCGTFGDGLFRSSDGGATWRPCGGISEDKIMSLASIKMSGREGPDVIYAGTEPSKILRSNDGGETWHELSTFLNLPSAGEWSFPPRPETHHVRFILPDPHRSTRIYAAVEAGALLRSDNAGETWRDRVPGGPLDTHTLASHEDAADRLYSAAGDGYFESRNGGDSWRKINDGLQGCYCWSLAVSRADQDTILVTAAKNAREAHLRASANSFVYRKTRGKPWIEIRDGLPVSQGHRAGVVRASAVEPGVFYFSTEGELFRSADDGESWQPLAVEWTGDQHPEHALAIAITEAGQG
jgi:photosystem II stability/assembly factor-like uncharacterized protein